MNPLSVPLFIRLARHHDRERLEILDIPLSESAAPHTFAGAQWRMDVRFEDKGDGRRAGMFSAVVTGGKASGVAAGLVWKMDDWSVENYVLIPGAVYAGNRFDAMRRPYSPKIRDIGQRGDRLLLDIGDIPRLNKDAGRSHLDQTSLDASVPGAGIRFVDSGRALMLLTPQTSSHGPIGIELIENDARDRAELMLLAPGFLHPLPGDNDPLSGIGNQSAGHKHPENARPADLAAGESIVFAFEEHGFPCADVHGLFERFFAHRTTMFPASAKPLPEVLPFSAAWDLLEQKHNAQNWKETQGLYAVGIPWVADQATQFWQNGWIGGGITPFALLQEGSSLSVERALRNLNFLLTDGVSTLGLFKATMSETGEWKGDRKVGGDEAWCRAENQKEDIPRDPCLCLVRRQGDCLLFVLRQLMLLGERGHAFPEAWTGVARRAAEAICDVWEREGEFGFLLNTETGKIAIRGSTSGAVIPAALALASTFFSEARFLRVARESAEFFRAHDLDWGVTTGGPGDALQAPDGESIFGLIESFISLFEVTGESVWLEAARRACHQGASWAIAYPYVFPANSALAQIGCDARGTMIANAQNKCGVPGICTLSGQGILRTFRSTGDTRLLDLLCDIAHALPQFLSREERRIPTRITWGHPFPELPAGWMCERVNITPSWAEPLGEQAAYSCWCEVAMMLTWCDLPGVYAQPDTGLLRCLDHVRAEWADASRTSLRIHNPTAYPARVRVQVESAAMAAQTPLSANYAAVLPRVEIAAGGTVIWRGDSLPSA